jgi:hypothetical protein
VLEGNDTQQYLKKIEACNLLRLMAMKLQEGTEFIFGNMHRSVIKTLENS